jgi:hypothetical protein
MLSRYTSLTPDEIVAFWAAPLDRSGECWIWQGSKNGRTGGRNAYGVFFIKREGKRVALKASRLLVTLRDGQEPAMACHTCDNPPCVRPSHLYAGTAKTNSDDAVARGRVGHPRGSARPDATRRLVAAIHENGDLTAFEWSDEISSWRSVAILNGLISTRAFIDRLDHGGRLAEVVA